MASEDLLKKAVAAFNALSPEQQAEMLEEQRQSWVRGNIGLSRDERGMTSPVMPQPTTVMASEHAHKIDGAVRKLRAVMEAFDMKGTNRATMLNAINTINALRTRPAPAATDTGLETVEHQYWHDQTQEWLPTGFPDRYRKDGFLVRELVTRSQAEELSAAERAENARLKLENEAQADQIDELQMTPWPEWASKVLAVIRKRSGYDGYDDAIEGVDLPAELDECMSELEADNAALIHDLNRIKDHETELVNDNVAQAARIKELDRCHEGTIDLCNQKTAQIEALEAKLAAAEKALEPFVSFFNEAMKGFTEGYAERTSSDKPVIGWNNAYLLMRHFIEARAVLGGKPS